VINDSLGHAVGDAVLLKLASRLLRHLRPTDTLARLGGDEFVIVAEGLSQELEIAELVTRIVECAREPVVLDGQPLECTLSVGVASTADSQHDPHELLREADLALYRAKDRGRTGPSTSTRSCAPKLSGGWRPSGCSGALSTSTVWSWSTSRSSPTECSVVGVEALVRVDDALRGCLSGGVPRRRRGDRPHARHRRARHGRGDRSRRRVGTRVTARASASPST